jgi:hypothetical protein
MGEEVVDRDTGLVCQCDDTVLDFGDTYNRIAICKPKGGKPETAEQTDKEKNPRKVKNREGDKPDTEEQTDKGKPDTEEQTDREKNQGGKPDTEEQTDKEKSPGKVKNRKHGRSDFDQD